MLKRKKYKKILELILLSITCFFWYTISFSHFKLNANIRLYHIVHEDGQMTEMALKSSQNPKVYKLIND